MEHEILGELERCEKMVDESTIRSRAWELLLLYLKFTFYLYITRSTCAFYRP